jgi:hypothetical protein
VLGQRDSNFETMCRGCMCCNLSDCLFLGDFSLSLKLKELKVKFLIRVRLLIGTGLCTTTLGIQSFETEVVLMHHGRSPSELMCAVGSPEDTRVCHGASCSR